VPYIVVGKPDRSADKGLQPVARGVPRLSLGELDRYAERLALPYPGIPVSDPGTPVRSRPRSGASSLPCEPRGSGARCSLQLTADGRPSAWQSGGDSRPRRVPRSRVGSL